MRWCYIAHFDPATSVSTTTVVTPDPKRTTATVQAEISHSTYSIYRQAVRTRQLALRVKWRRRVELFVVDLI